MNYMYFYCIKCWVGIANWPICACSVTDDKNEFIFLLWQANQALLEEIKEINSRLIDTVVDISDEDADPTATAAAKEGGEGTIVKCSYSAVALSPNLKSQYVSSQMVLFNPDKLSSSFFCWSITCVFKDLYAFFQLLWQFFFFCYYSHQFSPWDCSLPEIIQIVAQYF